MRLIEISYLILSNALEDKRYAFEVKVLGSHLTGKPKMFLAAKFSVLTLRKGRCAEMYVRFE